MNEKLEHHLFICKMQIASLNKQSPRKRGSGGIIPRSEVDELDLHRLLTRHHPEPVTKEELETVFSLLRENRLILELGGQLFWAAEQNKAALSELKERQELEACFSDMAGQVESLLKQRLITDDFEVEVYNNPSNSGSALTVYFFSKEGGRLLLDALQTHLELKTHLDAVRAQIK